MNQPEKKFRAGAISATVWQNSGQTKTGEQTTYKTISLERGYKDKDGSWKPTNSFRVNDLPKASLLLQKAYEFIVISEQNAHQPTEAGDLIEEDLVF